MNRTVLVCHCLLNPVTRAQGTKEINRDIIKVLIDENISIIQLPCPEIEYGLDFKRGPCSKDDYDTPGFREHCRTLARSTAEEVINQSKHSSVFGLIAVGGSPSCGFMRTHIKGEHAQEPGIFMEELAKIFDELGIKIKIVDHDILSAAAREQFLSP